MLDISKITEKIPKIGKYLRQEASANSQKLERGRTILQEAQKQQQNLIKKYYDWHQDLNFKTAIPVEPLDTCLNINCNSHDHSVFATDGSQIVPSHHEIAYCYLINIGRVILHYGKILHPLLESIPEVYYHPEDLNISRKWGIKTEEWLCYQRLILENQNLAQISCNWVDNLNNSTGHFLSIVDGPLTYWFLEGLSEEVHDLILEPIQEAWDKLKFFNIPLIGYVSSSSSIEGINFLRLHNCIFDNPDCLNNCNNFLKRQTPCQIIEPLKDITLWGEILKPGQRGPLWKSTSNILKSYKKKQHIYFCYINIGSEIARIEFPEWVAENSRLLNQALEIVFSQVNKGFGYPIALSEAHNQAVIHGRDRRHFFSMLERQMVQSGIRNVKTSYKETRKRNSIA